MESADNKRAKLAPMGLVFYTNFGGRELARYEAAVRKFRGKCAIINKAFDQGGIMLTDACTKSYAFYVAKGHRPIFNDKRDTITDLVVKVSPAARANFGRIMR